MIGHRSPRPLPNGRAILYTAVRRSSNAGRSVAVYIPETGQHQTLLAGDDPWFASSGHVVFNRRGGELWAVPFDADRVMTTGEPVLVREDVGVNNYGISRAYLGADGTLVYVPSGGSTDDRTLVWVDRDGNEEPVAAAPRPYNRPRLSPDGTRVVFDAEGDLWIHDFATDRSTQLTSDLAPDSYSVWTPDGQRVVFNRGYGDGLFWKAADGTGASELLVAEPGRALFPWSWSGDGTLLVNELDLASVGAFDIYAVTLGDENRRRPLIETAFAEGGAEISPDGQWMAFVSNRSGRFEIHVAPYPNVDREAWRVSTDGGLNHVWSPDGSELFFHQVVGCDRLEVEGCVKFMMSVSVETEPTFSHGRPEVLFEDPYFAPVGRQYDIHPDGDRFLMIKRATAPVRQINIVRNWVEELKERVPVP